MTSPSVPVGLVLQELRRHHFAVLSFTLSLSQRPPAALAAKQVKRILTHFFAAAADVAGSVPKGWDGRLAM
jgi:hypothetical protein